MRVYRNTIASFRGSWSSGIAELLFTDGSSIYADSGPLGRALIDAFDASAPGHCINSDAIAGEEVVYWKDDCLGLLEGFIPAENYIGPEIPAEGLSLLA